MPDQKVAIVIGGGSGIGAACVREFAHSGYHVVAMSPSGSAATLAKQLGGTGLAGSNRSVADLQSVVDLALSTYGRVDTVMNGSGHAARGPILELTDDDWREGMELYLLNVIRMTRIITPHFLAAGGGTIVNISTARAFEPNDMFPVSVTFRAGMASFIKMYANEYASRGIRINNVLPGFVKEDPSTIPAEWTSDIPMGRAQSTAELARVIRFLASDESKFITGQNIRVDGGATRSV
ncbi:MAG: SDR family oxidoreductase [Propionibacteriaceae bacterium]|nr:SDR family oxidoreductase [Propionibacteriaceae bacterium]